MDILNGPCNPFQECQESQECKATISSFLGMWIPASVGRDDPVNFMQDFLRVSKSDRH